MASLEIFLEPIMVYLSAMFSTIGGGWGCSVSFVLLSYNRLSLSHLRRGLCGLNGLIAACNLLFLKY